MFCISTSTVSLVDVGDFLERTKRNDFETLLKDGMATCPPRPKTEKGRKRENTLPKTNVAPENGGFQ